VTNVEFLGFEIDKLMEWKIHIEQIIPEMNNVCCAIILMYHSSNIDTHETIHCAYFHPIMNMGLYSGATLAKESSNYKREF
jgi:hypothetical protein